MSAILAAVLIAVVAAAFNAPPWATFGFGAIVFLVYRLADIVDRRK